MTWVRSDVGANGAVMSADPLAYEVAGSSWMPDNKLSAFSRSNYK